MGKVPWVTRLTKPHKCDGIKWSTVAMKDLYPSGPGGSTPARGIQDKSRCKMNAYWRFKALRSSTARSGVYCYTHLIYQGVYANMEEEARLTKWYEREYGTKGDDQS